VKKRKKISFKKILSQKKELPEKKETIKENKNLKEKTEIKKIKTREDSKKKKETKKIEPKEDSKQKIETKKVEPKEDSKPKTLVEKPQKSKITSKREEIMIVGVGNEFYGIPLRCVEEIRNEIKLTSTPQISEFLSGIAEIRDLIVPVVNLGDLFGIETGNKKEKKRPVIVVEISGQLVGIQVSKIVEIIEIQKGEILPLPDIFPPKLFSGGYSYKSIVVGIVNIESLLKGKQIQSFKEKINEVIK
jgi:purine-binding chemotaxis protein CheW